MTFLDEIAARLVAQGVGVVGTSIFLSSKALLPTGNGPYLSVTETGGTAPIRTHNAVATPAYQQPGAQLVARASTYPVARAMASAAYNALVGVRNVTLSGTYYREINVTQEPFDLGLDAVGRAQCVFNILAVKRPS